MADMPEIALRNAEVDSIGIPVGRFQTLREVNERNLQFRSEQSILMKQRMADADVFRVAMNDIESEWSRQVPVYNQKSLEEALKTAADTKARFEELAAKTFQTNFSKKGGAAPKQDRLQNLIVQIVQTNPRITGTALEAELENRKLGSVVIDIDYELDIIDFDNGGRKKSARITGLKDRLSRAKKTIAAEKQIASR
jgi:transketolase